LCWTALPAPGPLRVVCGRTDQQLGRRIPQPGSLFVADCVAHAVFLYSRRQHPIRPAFRKQRHVCCAPEDLFTRLFLPRCTRPRCYFNCKVWQRHKFVLLTPHILQSWGSCNPEERLEMRFPQTGFEGITLSWACYLISTRQSSFLRLFLNQKSQEQRVFTINKP
jgi:hypothetical protein